MRGEGQQFSKSDLLMDGRIPSPLNSVTYGMRLSRHYIRSRSAASAIDGGSGQVTDYNRVFYALWTTGVFLGLIWLVYWAEEILGWELRAAGGIRPRDGHHLLGILTYPLLHGDWEHLWNNSASFFTLNTLLFYFYRSIALPVWTLMYLCSGILLWLLGNPGNHIGASGMIYALAAFLFLSGWIRRNSLLKRVSLVVVFLYGGMVWWMLPVEEHISWAGHSAGAIVGVIMAIAFRHKGPVNDPIPTEDDSPPPAWWLAAHPEYASETLVEAEPFAEDPQSSPPTPEPQQLRRPATPASTHIHWVVKRDNPPKTAR